jgi:hypothetical protein
VDETDRENREALKVIIPFFAFWTFIAVMIWKGEREKIPART